LQSSCGLEPTPEKVLFSKIELERILGGLRFRFVSVDFFSDISRGDYAREFKSLSVPKIDDCHWLVL
jgi:hypothetical protein